MSLGEFFSMGGYAFYVWASYGLALIVLLANILLPRARHGRIVKRVQRNLRRELKH